MKAAKFLTGPSLVTMLLTLVLGAAALHGAPGRNPPTPKEIPPVCPTGPILTR